jgi:hypothetical protein
LLSSILIPSLNPSSLDSVSRTEQTAKNAHPSAPFPSSFGRPASSNF